MADKQNQAVTTSEDAVSQLDSIVLPSKEDRAESLFQSESLSVGSAIDNQERLLSKLELLQSQATSTPSEKTRGQGIQSVPSAAAPLSSKSKPSLLFRAIDFLAKFIKRWEERFFALFEAAPTPGKKIVLPEEEEEELSNRLGTRLRFSVEESSHTTYSTKN